MLKALLKKQLLEFFSGFSVKGKDGKAGGTAAKAGAVIMLLFVGFTFFAMFFSFSFMMAPVIESGNGELYLAVFGILSVLMGLMGSVFLTYNTLYEAKDNEELLNIAYETIPEIVERIDAFYEAFSNNSKKGK